MELNRRSFMGLIAAAPVIATAPTVAASLMIGEVVQINPIAFHRNAFAFCSPPITLDKWLAVEFEWDDYDALIAEKCGLPFKTDEILTTQVVG